MTRTRILALFSTLAVIGGVGAFFVWRQTKPAPQSQHQHSAPAPSGPIVYYRDPDGRPFYSATPKKTLTGKDYLPVRASEDVSFADKPPLPAGAGGERRVKFYRHPMGLPDTSPVPKKDAMGMDYVPVYEGEAQDSSTIAISPGKLQKTGVKSEPALRRTLNVPVRAAGKVEFDPRRISVVSLRFEGFIESAAKVVEGDYVRKGESLMRVFSPALSGAAAELIAVLKAGGDRTRVEGAKRRLSALGVDDATIAIIARARQVPRAVDWPAPQSGHILERAALSGMRAAPGETLFRIADHSIVWVLADISERDIGLITSGQSVSVRPRAYADRVFSGQVALIYPHLNMETRTARVRVELPNPDGLLRGDMYADVEIAGNGGAAVLAVPESAVIDAGKRQVVILDKGEGRFEPREVTLGKRGEGFVEIEKGVAEQDRVVTSANFLIDAESNLKAALRSLDQTEGGK